MQFDEKFTTPAWMIEWQGKFKEILVEGLTDGPTYVKLGSKSLNALDVVLAFRPMASRVTKDAVVIGGKLSVFPVKESIKAMPSSNQTMVGWLAGAYPSAVFPKRDKTRVGTLIAAVQDAPLNSGKAFITQLRELGGVEKMLQYIESFTGAAVENRKLVARALVEAFTASLPEFFADGGPEAPVGKPQTYTDGGNVVQLILKKQGILPPDEDNKKPH